MYVTRMHSVLRLWVRPEPEKPLVEVPSLRLVAGSGVEGDHAFGRMRHVTIVFADDWAAATRVLGRDVDPSARRANVLVAGGGGVSWIGRRVRLGTSVVEIKGIVSPCPVMDAAAQGLQEALRPDGRAGVWGRVVEDGDLVPGDELR